MPYADIPTEALGEAYDLAAAEISSRGDVANFVDQYLPDNRDDASTLARHIFNCAQVLNFPDIERSKEMMILIRGMLGVGFASGLEAWKVAEDLHEDGSHLDLNLGMTLAAAEEDLPNTPLVTVIKVGEFMCHLADKHEVHSVYEDAEMYVKYMMTMFLLGAHAGVSYAKSR